MSLYREWAKHSANQYDSYLDAVRHQSTAVADSLRARKACVRKYAWAVPDEVVLDKIIQFVKEGDLVEIGCGKGYWISLLKAKADGTPLKLHAVDNYSEVHENDTLYCDVQKEDGDIWLAKNSTNNSCLFLCWPRQLFLTHFKGNKLIIIGEGADGSTAHLEDANDEWVLYDIYEHPRWIGMWDKTYFYTRKDKITQSKRNELPNLE